MTGAGAGAKQPTRRFAFMIAATFFFAGAAAVIFAAASIIAITEHPDGSTTLRWALGIQAFFLALASTSSLAAAMAILAAINTLHPPGLRR